MFQSIKQLVTYQIEALRYCEMYRDTLSDAQGIHSGDFNHLFGDYELLHIAFDLLGFPANTGFNREYLYDDPIFDPSVRLVPDEKIELYVRWLMEQTLPGAR